MVSFETTLTMLTSYELEIQIEQQLIHISVDSLTSIVFFLLILKPFFIQNSTVNS